MAHCTACVCAARCLATCVVYAVRETITVNQLFEIAGDVKINKHDANV